LTNRGQVLIGGKRYTIAGTVTMDYIMVDAGPESTIKVGDEAVLIGEQGAHSITPDEMALHCETIGYEVLCGLSPRVERHYLHNSKIFLKTPGVLY
jgi:alanine racemase